MYDERGPYYYPNPADADSRVYVRQGEDGIEFRLWHTKYPEVWEKHGWVPQAALEQAAVLYRNMGKEGNPLRLYDMKVAEALLQEERRRQENA